MITFLCDDRDLKSCFINAETWEEAEEIALEHDYTLIGEYVETLPGPFWLTYGETMQ